MHNWLLGDAIYSVLFDRFVGDSSEVVMFKAAETMNQGV
jgi:hypothetical protein